MDNIEIQNLTSDVYLLSVLTPEFLEEVAARVEELMAERKQQDQSRQEDTRIEQRALELD
ncbi:MAG: hypothetical protein HY866_08045 [Chloroflexi bacterium]|nr:hypothetical protein [Chloroflexota bacterium]